MDNNELIKIMTEGEIVEIFPYDDATIPVESGYTEALVIFEDNLHYVLLDQEGKAVKLNHMSSLNEDYDSLEEGWGVDDDWSTLDEFLDEDDSWEEEE